MAGRQTGKARVRTRIKKGDTVVVIAGADKGKTGKVISVDRETGRVLVEGVKRVTKHVRAGQTGRGSRTGGLVHTEAPIHLSNVAVVDPETKQPTRVGIRTETQERDGRERTVRVRVAKRSGKDIA
ncbi:50S ribosomal protein L24 [Actinosynnema sp.]|uniref:50S ribosomal protein L24 n=1 Tax=Actinosynnema sp. TaxID=1872144 RepID=UPI003F84D8E7